MNLYYVYIGAFPEEGGFYIAAETPQKAKREAVDLHLCSSTYAEYPDLRYWTAAKDVDLPAGDQMDFDACRAMDTNPRARAFEETEGGDDGDGD